MDKKRFELTMESFFSKAGVRLMRKGSDYQAGDEAASYILLDQKRKTYYLTETDAPSDGLEDMEISAAAAWLAEKNSLSEDVAKAVLLLGRAVGVSVSDKDFPEKDGLSEKSALIASEENVPALKAYFSGKGISSQSAALKGAFLAMFFDKNASAQLADIYKTSTKEYMESVSPQQQTESASISLDDLVKDIQPPEEEETPPQKTESNGNQLSFDNIIDNVPPMDEEEEKPEDAPLESIGTEKDGKITDDEEKSLDALDISFVQSNPEPELSETESDLLYSKIINEQSKNITDAPAPKAKNTREIPQDILEFVGEETPDNKEKETEMSTAEKKEPIKIEKKSPAKEPVTEKDAETVRESFAAKAAANLSGFIFFAPAYLIGKITRRVLPPFVVYWLAAIAVIFGAYQAVLPFLSPFIYKWFTESAAEAAASINAFIPASRDLSPLNNAAVDMVISSVIFFHGQISAASAIENGWLLRYLMSFGALLMIFPLSRSFGARVSVFSVLFFFCAPLILGAESYILSSLAVWAKGAENADGILSALASGVVFTVFVVPIILTAVIFLLSGHFVPQKERHKNVMP